MLFFSFFIPGCGAKNESAAVGNAMPGMARISGTPGMAGNGNAPIKKKMPVWGKCVIGVISVAVVAAIVLVCFQLFVPRSSDRVIRDFMKAFINDDVKKIASLVPEELASQKRTGGSRSVKAEVTAGMEKGIERIKTGVNSEDLRWEVVKEEHWADYRENAEVAELLEGVDLKVTEAKRSTIEFNDGKTETREIEVYMVKIGASWHFLCWSYTEPIMLDKK